MADLGPVQVPDSNNKVRFACQRATLVAVAAKKRRGFFFIFLFWFANGGLFVSFPASASRPDWCRGGRLTSLRTLIGWLVARWWTVVVVGGRRWCVFVLQASLFVPRIVGRLARR